MLGGAALASRPRWSRRADGRRRSTAARALLAFAALAALTALSIIWSVPVGLVAGGQPDARLLAVFAAGIALVRLAPRRWAALLGGVASRVASSAARRC